MTTRITTHAYERLKARANVKGTKCEDFIARVWATGKRISDFESPRTRKYLNNVKACDGTNRELVVFGNDIYVFTSDGSSLITVLDMPQKVCRDSSGKHHKKGAYSPEYDDMASYS